MACSVRRVDYFTTTITDQPGEAYKLLTTLANLGITLLAFTAVPIGPLHTHLTLFPGDTGKLPPKRRRLASCSMGLIPLYWSRAMMSSEPWPSFT